MSIFSKISSGKRKDLLLILLLGLVALGTSFVIIFLGPEKGAVVSFAILGISLGIYSLINYVFGFYLTIGLSFFIFSISRFFDDRFPFGSWIDLLTLVTFLGLIVNKIISKERFFTKSKGIITYAYLIYTLFLLLELFNPSMDSVEGWFFVLRKYLQFIMIYFIAINIFDSFDKVKYFFKFWIIFAFIAGAYGCYQEWFGFLPFEEDWIMSNPARMGLYLLVTGIARKFSTFSDPAAYGIIMAATFVFVIVLILFTKKRSLKILLTIINVFILLGSVYSGTRTAYFIIAAGLVVYILMTITNRNTLIFACVFVLGFMFILFGPIYGNATINRIRSTFEFSEEASMKVRDDNRAMIQPYVYRHPIGGGLATSGVQGFTYNPNHFLAGFPPDSGFVKTMLETGWIGLFLQCLLYFLILQTGTHAYYTTRNKNLRIICLASMICVFSFILGQFGQVAIGQIPGSFLFYSCLAYFTRIKYLDAKS